MSTLTLIFFMSKFKFNAPIKNSSLLVSNFSKSKIRTLMTDFPQLVISKEIFVRDCPLKQKYEFQKLDFQDLQFKDLNLKNQSI